MVTLDEVIVPAPVDGERVDPRSWFAGHGPLELEIGCGKGGFLLHRAKANPDRNFLGIEWANQFYRFTADRMARWGLGNVRVMRTDAKEFVLRHLFADCLSALHLYHPDPWPKKRHHKRRLVQDDFAAAAVTCLKSGAEWLIQSDHEEYFLQMRDVLGRRSELQEIPWDAAACRPESAWSGTNFEVKYVREGRAIHRAAYVRT